MKIIKEPQFDICECERCGTVFQPETGDHLTYQFGKDNPFSINKVFIRCPTCDMSIEVRMNNNRKGGAE